MPVTTDRRRQLPKSLVGLAGLACIACCLVPLLLVAGVLAGAGWAAVVDAIPLVAMGVAVAASLIWWALARRKNHTCGPSCTCSKA